LKNKIIILSFSVLVILTINSCKTTKAAYSNKENLYKKNNQELNAVFVAYHISDSLTQLYFKIPNGNLIYKRPDTSSSFIAAVKLKYFLFSGAGSKQLLDSGSTFAFDRQGENVFSKDMKGNMVMHVNPAKNYSAEIHVYDLNKKSKSAYVLNINKSNYHHRQNFLLQKNNGQIIFDYYLQQGDTVVIKSFLSQNKEMKADYFYREFPLAPPPFSTVERSAFNYKPDSSFMLNRQAGLLKLIMPEKGFYHLISDPDSKTGITLYTFEKSFPGIKNETEMIRSTRFIMSKKEYDLCMNSTNKKQAIDDFWLDIGGSNERARELLKKYYGRVTESNKLFTSHQPGWQTDRGMIYIVFGAPSTMHKYNDGETWIYGNESQSNSIRFNFKKVINPFSDNDFMMERSEYYKDAWYNAVEYWRQGRIYMDN